jgi:hypothetical protein
VTGGAGGFLLTGISAYVHHNLCAPPPDTVALHRSVALTPPLRARRVFFLDASEIQFFPQGLVRRPSRPSAAQRSVRADDWAFFSPSR